LKNKWWYDLNFPIGSKLIMTFEPIGPEHLELLDFQEEVKRRREIKRIEFNRKLVDSVTKRNLEVENIPDKPRSPR
jgi:hypothetical protein